MLKLEIVAYGSSAGDVWYFPPGVPHSIQAFDQGAELLLVFDDVGFCTDLYSFYFILSLVFGTLSEPSKDISLFVFLDELPTECSITGILFPGNFDIPALRCSISQYHAQYVVLRGQMSCAEEKADQYIGFLFRRRHFPGH